VIADLKGKARRGSGGPWVVVIGFGALCERQCREVDAFGAPVNDQDVRVVVDEQVGV
jgi:hypothetical protein